MTSAAISGAVKVLRLTPGPVVSCAPRTKNSSLSVEKLFPAVLFSPSGILGDLFVGARHRIEPER